jgi:hypothetical protein
MNTLTGGDGPPALVRINARSDRKNEQQPSLVHGEKMIRLDNLRKKSLGSHTNN